LNDEYITSCVQRNNPTLERKLGRFEKVDTQGFVAPLYTSLTAYINSIAFKEVYKYIGTLTPTQRKKKVGKNMIEIKNIHGHFEVYKDNKFLFSADTMREVKEELQQY